MLLFSIIITLIIMVSYCICTGIASGAEIEVRTMKGGDAKCIDGTTPSYFFRKGYGAGVHKWHLHHQGGGWCFNAAECAAKAQESLGSSRVRFKHEKSIAYEPFLSPDLGQNPLMHDWNIVYVAYCDAGSYAGNTDLQHMVIII